MNEESERGRPYEEIKEEEVEPDTEVQEHSLVPPSSVPEETEKICCSQLPVNEPFQYPTLVHRTVNDEIITSNDSHDQVFSSLINYSYGTRNNPQLESLIGSVAYVLKMLYIRLDGLETLNTMLQDSLEAVEKTLDIERQISRLLESKPIAAKNC